MQKLHWDDTFSVGVHQMDEEHKNILLIVNLMVDHAGESNRSETITEILGRLTTYAYQHFEHEERLLLEHGYPDVAAQRQEHQDFRRQIATFCLNVMEQPNSQNAAPEGLLLYLLEWWKEHILGSDMKYRPFFKTRGIS